MPPRMSATAHGPRPSTPPPCRHTQVKRPAVDLPLGILGALGIVTVCYILMAATLVLMVPLGSLDLGAPFAAAFRCVRAGRAARGGGSARGREIGPG